MSDQARELLAAALQRGTNAYAAVKAGPDAYSMKGYKVRADQALHAIDAALALRTPPSTEAESVSRKHIVAVEQALADAREALIACRDQFASYNREHLAAGKIEKATTNAKFALIANAAILNLTKDATDD